MKKVFIGTLICTLLLILISCGDSTTTSDDGKHTHDYGEWKIVQKATCTEDGLKEKVCSCGKKKTKEIEKGQTIVLDAAVAPSCSTEGMSEGSHCTVCGEIIE